MNIHNHLIQDVEYIPTSNNSGVFSQKPTLLVMHFTASGLGIRNDALYFANQLEAKTSASAHVLLSRDGGIIQCVPFNKIAHHAGSSVWRGKTNCNRFSIGIEIDNWGELTRRADGGFYSHSGKQITAGEVVHARHKHRSEMDYWDVYPEVQLRMLAAITQSILAAYPSINEVVGHDDIAPGRKVDPGPAFPLRRFQALAEDRSVSTIRQRKVLASALNVRSGPGVHYNPLSWGPLKRNAIVTVKIDGPEWDMVEYKGKVGWVASQYLG